MLIDTNIIFSALLQQNDFENSRELLSIISKNKNKFSMTDFALYSLCLELIKRKEILLLSDFLYQFIHSNTVKIEHLPANELISMINDQKIQLDFDDKLHYWLAKKYNLQLVSYDKHFDQTDLKRLTPAQALKKFGKLST